jgi:hypothetical protein
MKKHTSPKEPSEDKSGSSVTKKPLKVLSTSLGLMLAGHLVLAPALSVETVASAASPAITATAEPKLVEWSSEEVKTYYSPNVDWSIPLPKEEAAAKPGEASPTPSASTSGGSSAPIANHIGSGFGGGFGWDDLLLYHMIFNRGGLYSSSNWVNNRPSYDYRTNQPYKPQTYANRPFANQPAAGMTTPRTNSRTGTFSTNKSSSGSSSGSSSKSTSSSSGSIGSKSSGFSSSSGG